MKNGLLLLLLMVTILKLPAQHLPTDITNKIDSLFSELDLTSPGCAISIVRNDSILYTKGYGLANLEYKIANTPETVFNLASVSKQFTGYGIALLAAQGKVDLEQDVHTYLTWVPDFKKKITVKHLLQHTSGIRDHLLMALWGGVGYNGIMTQDLAVKYIKEYNSLNFHPGENQNYCNSNYILLAEIIKAQSGQSLNRFMDSAIFKPLEMSNTFFAEDHTTIIKNRAASYFKSGTAYTNIIQNVYTTGDGGIFSTATDVAKWAINFFHPKAGTRKDIDLLTKTGTLNNGFELTYGMGVISNDYKGYKRFFHTGGLAGYRTNVTILPELKLGIVILSNFPNVRTSFRVEQIADIFLQNYPSKAGKAFTVDSSKMNIKDTLLAKQFSGKYIADDGTHFSFSYKNGKLLWDASGQPLIVIGNNKFALATDTMVNFQFTPSSKDTVISHRSYTYFQKLTKYKPDSTTGKRNLTTYTGTYHSPELDMTIQITTRNNQLLIQTLKLGEETLKIATTDDLFIDNWRTHLRMIRDSQKKITGFQLSDGYTSKILFNKILNNK